MNPILIIATLTILFTATLGLVLRQLWVKISLVSYEPGLALIDDYRASSAQKPFDAVRWAQRNNWLLEGQPDDRRPVNGSVRESNGSASVRRSFARHSHQVSYKEWSKQRHD